MIHLHDIRYVRLGTRDLDPQGKESVFLRSRRGFKMVVHTAILAFLVSGTYNAWRNWPQYAVNHWLLHPLWGAHLLLGLTVFTISIVIPLRVRTTSPGR